MMYVFRPGEPVDFAAIIELTELWASEPSTTGHYEYNSSENTDWQRTLGFYQKHGFRPWFFMMFTGPSTEERSAEVEG